MANNNHYRIGSIHLEMFTVFEKAEIDFSQGLNVLIGENSTGKTHLLKLIYSSIAAVNTLSEKDIRNIHEQSSTIAGALLDYFKPDTLGRLKRRSVGSGSAKVRIEFLNQNNNKSTLAYSFSSRSKNKVDIEEVPPLIQTGGLYLPALEMLTLSEGFIGAYENRETAYDKTYYDLAKALESAPLRGARQKEASELIEPIITSTRLTPNRKGSRFYLKFTGDRASDIEASLASEGIKKLAMLIYLVKNGELTQNSILFWDEPEAHLNPKQNQIVSDFIFKLSSMGVQVFVASHDYLLTQRLNFNQQQRNLDPSPHFISLVFESGELSTEVVKNLDDIEHNPILEAFADFATEELTAQ